MKYSLKEKIEQLLEHERRTKKSLYEFLGMSMQGFDAMMKNNTFTAVRVEKIAEFFEISISELYGATEVKSESLPAFGEQTLSKMAKDIDELKAMFEEQLRAKDLQIAGLQRTVDVLVGKSEGVTKEPTSPEYVQFMGEMSLYANLVADQYGIEAKILQRVPPFKDQPRAKLVAPRSQTLRTRH